MTNFESEPVTPNPDGTLRFPDGSELRLTDRDRPPRWKARFSREVLPTCRICGAQYPNHVAGFHDRDDTASYPTLNDISDDVHYGTKGSRPGKWETRDYRVGWDDGYAKAYAELSQLPIREEPMRIRCMTLPAEIQPDGTPVKPFILVIDRAGDQFDSDPIRRLGDSFIEQTTALGVVVYEGEVQIGDD